MNELQQLLAPFALVAGAVAVGYELVRRWLRR